MLVRQVVVPASPEELWDALTEPDSVAAWFGARVDWDLRPGGPARFIGDDGTVRGGVVEAVRRGCHLRFRWWPESDGAGPAEGAETTDEGTEVTYDLEADHGGTRLTVTEQRLGARLKPGTEERGSQASGSQASERGADSAVVALGVAGDPRHGVAITETNPWSWTDWDGRLFRCWACAAAPALVRC